MAGISENYNLTLPELEDKITESIPQIAENFSEIDRVMKANEEKIDTDIANTSAEFDSKLNTAKNKLTADLQSTQKQLEEGIEVATKAIFGTYVGTGTKGRTINLGFTPVAVYICSDVGATALSSSYRGGLALGNGYHSGGTNGSIENRNCCIVQNGFSVSYNASTQTNNDGTRYYFIAFKNGEIMEVS